MGNASNIHAGCMNRLVEGAYRARTCWMPCGSSNETVKRAVVDGLKGTPRACSLEGLSVIRDPYPATTDLYPELALPKGFCEFGWSCQKPEKSWNAFARLLWSPVEVALKRLIMPLE